MCMTVATMPKAGPKTGPQHGHSRGRGHLLDREAPSRQGTAGYRATDARRTDDGCDAVVVQRAHARPRIWRWGFRCERRHALFFQLRRSAYLSPTARFHAAAADASDRYVVTANLFPPRGGCDVDRIGVCWVSLAPPLRRDDDADPALPPALADGTWTMPASRGLRPGNAPPPPMGRDISVGGPRSQPLTARSSSASPNPPRVDVRPSRHGCSWRWNS